MTHPLNARMRLRHHILAQLEVLTAAVDKNFSVEPEQVNKNSFPLYDLSVKALWSACVFDHVYEAGLKKGVDL